MVTFLMGLTIHEFGHALAADLQGDRTARNAGRLTLDPRSHLDPLGTTLIVLAGFGWGKPVPFNPRNLRNKRFGTALVALAGPMTNVVLALIGGALIGLLNPGETLLTFLYFMVLYNVLMAVFNLIPIPPLDGSRILASLLPPSRQHVVFFLDKWGFLLLFVLVFFFSRPFLYPLILRISGSVISLFSGL